MKKVLIAGNPNTGKTLLFSRLTEIGAITANYAGTTVKVKTGRFTYLKNSYELLDAPGIYSLEPFSKAEETTVRLIDEADIVINVVDATSLERNLGLTLHLIKKRKPMVVCLNFWDDTAHRGISIDRTALEGLLGVPVVAASALSGEGMNALADSLSRARESDITLDTKDDWCLIGSIVGKVQKLAHRHHTILERVGDFTIHPIGGIVSAALVLGLVFLCVRFLGEGLLNGVFEPFYSRYYQPFILHLTSLIPYEIIRGLLAGHTVDPLHSFGILTTGAYIAMVLVFPYFFSFYLLFGVLEDSGYLPRLAVVLDSFFHRLGLHGYSSIPVMLGLGCKVPAFLAMRILTNKREKILTAALILMCAPCLPQSVMIVSLGMNYGVVAVITVFAVLFVLALLMNIALNKIVKGETSELFVEIPPYRFPSPRILAGKLWIRTADYFKEVLPMIIVGVLIINMLDSLKATAFVSATAGKILAMLLGLPHDIAPVLILGFLRKDVSIALLAPFHLAAGQFIVAAVFMVLYIPCVASFFTLMKELGIVLTLKITGLVFAAALMIAFLLHGIFLMAGTGGG